MNKKRKIAVSLLMFFFCFSVFSNLTLSLTETENRNMSINSISSPNWRLTETELVSSESTSDSQFSDIAVDNNGNVHVVWQDYQGDWEISYKRWEASTSTWTTSEHVSWAMTSGPSYQPAIDVDSSGNAYVVWMADQSILGGDREIFFGLRNESTSSWTLPQLISTAGPGDSQWPDINVDSARNVYVCWHDTVNYLSSGTDSDILYRKRDIDTGTFSTTEVVSNVSSGDSQHPSIVADDNGNVFIAWQDVSTRLDEDIYFRRWNETSSSWTGTEILTTATEMKFWYADITLDTKGNIHLVCEGDGTGTATNVHRIIYMQWNEEQNTWFSPTILRTVTNNINGPKIRTDIADNIFISWEYTVSSGVESDIEFIKYDSVLNYWTSPMTISPNIIDQPSYHSIAVDILGHLHIAWYDEIDYLSSGVDRDIFYRKYIGSPLAPTLAKILPNPTEVSNINLYWEDIFSATNYYIYRSDIQIFTLDGMIPIDSTTNNFYLDPLSSEGYYYYVIVAENFAGNSSISNCEYIQYILPSLQEFTIVSSLILSTFVVLFVVMRTRKKPNLN